MPWLLSLLLCGCYVSEQDIGVSGLWTSPNTKVPRPPGALDLAREVVFRRAKLVEPRPGFELGPEILAEGVNDIRALIPFDGDVLRVTDSGNHWENDTVSGAMAFTAPYIRGQEARGNLYLTSIDAMRKVTSSAATDSTRMGAPQVICRSTAGTGTTALEAQKTIAVRVLVRRTDINEVVTRSAPSARSILSNTSGGTVNVDTVCYFHVSGDVAAGDVLELYRSYPVPYGYPPSDELYLMKEHEVTSANVSTGSVTINSGTVDADLGQALYTNSSRESLDRRNVRPPLGKDVALFQGSLFMANLTYPPALVLRVQEGDGASLDMSGSATGVGYREITGTRTNGSATISGASSTTGLQVGMILQQTTDWGGTAHVRITAINGTNITMSEQWLGSTDGAPFTQHFADSIRIKSASEDLYYPARVIIEVSVAVQGRLTGAVSFRAVGSALYTAFPLGSAIEYDGTSVVPGTRRAYVIEGLDPDAESFEVFATHGDEYEPVLPLPTASTGEPSIQDVLPNGITWSKNEQPEHFMRGSGHVRLIGDSTPILRVVSTKDALWVLKGKGGRVYRLGGYGEVTGWRVDPDAEAYLLHPGLATAMGDAVYAWTDQGAARLSDAGFYPVSVPIEDQTAVIEQMLDHTKCGYAFAVANHKEGEIIFGLPRETDLGIQDNVTDKVFVFNAQTQAWAQWFYGEAAYKCGAYDPSTRLLWFGRDGEVTPRIEREPDPDQGAATYGVLTADRESAMTISDVTDNVITFSEDYPALGESSPFTAGRMLSQSGNFAMVVSVDQESPAIVTVDDGSAFTAAAATLYEAFESRIRWLPKHSPSASLVKHFRSVVTHWDDTLGVYGWDQEFSTVRNPSSVDTLSYTRALQRATVDTRADTRALVPRGSAKASQLYPALVIRQADSRWRIAGITIQGEAVSERVSR